MVMEVQMADTVAQTKPNVWIIEDDEIVLTLYRAMLQDKYVVTAFTSLDEFQSNLDRKEIVMPDLIIADMRVGEGNFLGFLSEREIHENDAVLVVSSVDDIDVLRECFSKGVRDYLVKPFKKTELLVKIEQILKTRGMPARMPISVTPFEFDIDQVSMQVKYRGQHSTTLTSKEFQMFSIFKNAPIHRMSRDELLALIWKGMKVPAKTLDVHLFNLRRKIQPLGLYIEFESPHFYRLVPRD